MGGRENVNLNQWENKISLLCPPNGHCSYLFPFCQTECREHKGAQTFHPWHRSVVVHISYYFTMIWVESAWLDPNHTTVCEC